MKVKDLIAMLQDLPQDHLVVVEGASDVYRYQEPLFSVEVGDHPGEVVINHGTGDCSGMHCHRVGGLKEYLK